jgi:UDP-glucuronate 4-epimerase
MTSPGERVLVTGAAGFIGSHLVEHLLARGDTVVGVDNFDPFYSPEEKRGNLAGALASSAFTLVEADCSEPDALEAHLGQSEFDVVVHLAAKAGVRPSLLDPVGYQRANVLGTGALLEFARRHGVRRFVFGSSSSVYGNAASVPFREDEVLDRPISPYAATKRAGELLCYTYHHLHGTTILALRFFTVYGPRQRPDLAIRKFATQMLRGDEITLFGDGTTERDYTWIDDIIQGTVAAVDRTRERPGEFEVINLGESRTTSLRRLVEVVAAAVGVEPKVVQRPMQPGDVVRTYADVSKARDLLGYSPGTLVEEGIPRFVAWLKEHVQQQGRSPATL